MNSSIVYEDQSANDLCLHVIKGLIDTSQFTIVEKDHESISGMKASIIGGSHCIQWEHKGNTFSEVFACTPVEADNVFLARALPKMGTRPLSVDLGWATYSIDVVHHKDFSRDQMMLTDLQMQSHDASLTPGEIGLRFMFPAGENGVIPQTLLVTKLKGKVYTVLTAHSYPLPLEMPAKGDIVFTKSILTIK